MLPTLPTASQREFFAVTKNSARFSASRRIGYRKAAVALAAKHARTIRAMLVRGESCRVAATA